MDAVGVRWSRPWLIAWGIVAVGLIAVIPFIPFQWWALFALVGFGGMEGYGLRRPDDAFPPLTQLIHRYVPRIIAFPLMFGIWGAAAAAWLHIPRIWRLFLLLAVLGFITTHFDVTFDEGKVRQEREKRRRIAGAVSRLFSRTPRDQAVVEPPTTPP